MTTVAQPTPVQTDAGARREPLAAAKAPVGPGLITAVGVLLALTLVGLGVVAIHDALITSGLAAGSGWIDSGLNTLDRLEPAPWMVPAGLVMVLVGLGALLIAVRPRPNTGIALTARTGVYLRPQDVARLARAASENVDAVTSATASASRRTVTMSVRATATGQVATDVQTAVAAALDALATAPKIRVRVTPERGQR